MTQDPRAVAIDIAKQFVTAEPAQKSLARAISQALTDARRQGMNAVVDALEDVMSQDADILTDDAVWKFIEAQRQASKEAP